MKPGIYNYLLTPFFVAIFAVTGCSVPKEGPATITKVNPEHVYKGKKVRTTDQMVRFEHLRKFHGTLESRNYDDVYGHYFTIFWVSEDKRPVTVRLNYRLGQTASTIHTQEVEIMTPSQKCDKT